ncbi:MAG: arsenate reductase (glutaredoxin) [Flavobacteriaceae bacterium]|nr:arsenate reductase (glutaredoxin) [Flavobacteriaceae bacterium]
MLTIFHNPRCRKSREGLALLEDSKLTFEIRDYLNNPPEISELKSLAEKLHIEPMGLVRQNEAIWKEKFKNKNLTDEQIYQGIRDFPVLLERPIVVLGNQAAIGRPKENILEILKSQTE